MKPRRQENSTPFIPEQHAMYTGTNLFLHTPRTNLLVTKKRTSNTDTQNVAKVQEGKKMPLSDSASWEKPKVPFFRKTEPRNKRLAPAFTKPELLSVNFHTKNQHKLPGHTVM